eukprot:gene34469-42509_t
MRQAIHHNRSSSRFAIITEDDIQIPFDIDFEALAATAPKGFGILQLFDSNEESMQSLWNRYVKDRSLWTESFQHQPASFWSTCAYLIDREVMRPIIDQIAVEKNGLVHLKIIAGIKKPCRPKLTDCCIYQNESMTFRFVHEAPCVWAAKGFQADSFIYATTKTYVLNIPLITNGAGGNQSTFHQDHVENIHASAFARQREYINLLISGKVPLPPFATAACNAQVPTGMTLTKAEKCKYPDQTGNSSSVSVHWLNLDEHYRQRDNINTYLHDVLFRQHRKVSAVNATDLFLPQDVGRTWETKHCTYQSDSINDTASEYVVHEQLPLDNKRLVIVSGLCGRGKGHNNLGDLAVTVSHLLALHQAVYNTPTTHRLSLVVEDDIQIPFDIDFEALAATAPKGFGILQLVTSHEQQMERQWNKFVRDKSDLWSGSTTDKYYDGWATKAYLIDREVVRVALDALVRERVITKPSYRRVMDVKVLAGLVSPCAPLQCCVATNSTDPANMGTASAQYMKFSEGGPCVLSKSGFQAERFLFHLVPTYVLNVPLVTSNLNGVHSELRGEAALSASQWGSLKKQREYMNQFLSESVALPSFAKIGCNVLLDLKRR